LLQNEYALTLIRFLVSAFTDKNYQNYTTVTIFINH